MSKSVARRLLSQLSNEDLKFMFDEIFDKFILSIEDTSEEEWFCTDREVAEDVKEWFINWLSGRHYREDD